MNLLRFFLKLFHDNLHRIGNLFIVVEQNLFPDNLIHEETGRLIRPLILSKIRRRIGQQFFDPLHHIVYIELWCSRNRNNFGLGKQLFPFFHQLYQFFLICKIYLIDEQENRHRHLTHLFHKLIILIRRLHHVRYIKQDIRIRQCRSRKIQHRLL